MPPEVFKKANYDQKFDVFSIGVILWTMLACDFPFNDDSVQGLSYKIQFSEPEWKVLKNKNVSEECLDLLRKLLTKDRTLRVSLDDALTHPWFKKEMNKISNAVLTDTDKEKALYSLNSYNKMTKL